MRWRSRWLSRGSCALCCMPMLCLFVCVRPGSCLSSCCYLKLRLWEDTTAQLPVHSSSLSAQWAHHFASRWLSDDACSSVPTSAILLVHVGSHRSSLTPMLVVLWLSSCPENHSWPLSDLKHCWCQSGINSSRTVLVLETKKNMRRAGCILSISCYFWGLFQSLCRVGQRHPLSWNCLVCDRSQTAGLTTSFGPLLHCSCSFFIQNPSLLFLRFVRDDRLSVFESLTHWLTWACPSALKYQMVYLCWYCRSVGFVYCRCVWMRVGIFLFVCFFAC